MDIISLKRKHKKILVESAFRIYKSNYQSSLDINIWTDRLIDGYDFQAFLTELKNGEVEIINDSTIGEIKIIDENLEFYAAQSRTLEVSIKNLTDKSFETTDMNPLYISYHWYKEDGSHYFYDGIRTKLETPVQPNEYQIMSAKIISPNKEGNYQLLVTLVEEGHAWLEEHGLVTTPMQVEIKKLKLKLSAIEMQMFQMLKRELSKRPVLTCA